VDLSLFDLGFPSCQSCFQDLYVRAKLIQLAFRDCTIALKIVPILEFSLGRAQHDPHFTNLGLLDRQLGLSKPYLITSFLQLGGRS
jgi:hypothetical protein